MMAIDIDIAQPLVNPILKMVILPFINAGIVGGELANFPAIQVNALEDGQSFGVGKFLGAQQKGGLVGQELPGEGGKFMEAVAHAV